jgi:sugar phosphate isomerase/epimerase
MKIAAKVAPNVNELEVVKDVGFENIEVFTNKNYLKNNFADNLNSFDFDYAVHAPTDNYDENVVDFAASINAKIVVVHDVVETEKLARIVELADSLGINICVEFPSVAKKSGSSRFLELKRQIEKCRMCLDVEHAIVRNEFPLFLNIVAKDIYNVHISGSPPKIETPPQDNPEQVKMAVAELRKIDYSGFLVAEMGLEYQKREIFIKTKEFLEGLLNRE